MRRRLFLRIPLVLFLLLVPFHNRAVTESPWSTSGEKATMFLTARTFPVGGSRSSSPVSVVVEDFNGDGKLDMVTANFGTNNVSVLLGDGNGIFQAAVNYSVGSYPNSVVIGDFNGDGKLDMVTANFGTNNVSVLLGNGDGTFQAAVNSAVGYAPVSVAVGDFNGDGELDLATANNYSKT